MRQRRILVMVKRSGLERLRAPRGQEKLDRRLHQLLKRHDQSVRSMEISHEEHQESLAQVRQELRARGFAVVERDDPPRRPIDGYDLVIAVGGDGTLLQLSHSVRGRTPLLGVNSSPTTSVGFLTGCRAPTFARTLDAVLSGKIEPLIVQRLSVRIGRRKIPEPVLNDVLFCHDNPAVTTRYQLSTPTDSEVQRSSGIWVATPAGSTAALRSAGGDALPLTARNFAFVVREPYAPPGSRVLLRKGVLGPKQDLSVELRSAPASVFVDGSHRRYAIELGERVTFSLHPSPLHLIRPQTR